MQEYDDDNTPLDQYDSDCHSCEGGVLSVTRFQEEELVFLINLSELVKRPSDIMMFLGEYFKMIIRKTQKIHDAILNEREDVSRQQTDFYLTTDILNYLGTACKMMLENPRQELRISTALSRNPSFQDEQQLVALCSNTFSAQVDIIQKCCGIFKFIDYFHDRKFVVPIKNPLA